jgi:hypothetical protein
LGLYPVSSQTSVPSAATGEVDPSFDDHRLRQN